MLKHVMRIGAWALIVLAGIGVILVAVVTVRWKRTFDAPYPNLQASRDPEVIERGRYLAYGPAHCVNCHTSRNQEEAIQAGATPPLSGGNRVDLPFGVVFMPNLTPDPETGIGRYTDAELARLLRHGVRPDGRAALPFMEFQNLSDEDMTAVISFLRSQEPVKNAVPAHQFNLIGKAVLAFLIKPVGPSLPVRTATPAEGTIERGEYVAVSVAGCAACHTNRDLLTGKYLNARFSGGLQIDIEGDAERVMVTPNLTPSSTGRITDWSEERFLGRFGAGVGIVGTRMPWRQYQKMSDSDLRDIYRYLRTLEPVDHDTGPSVQPKKRARKP